MSTDEYFNSHDPYKYVILDPSGGYMKQAIKRIIDKGPPVVVRNDEPYSIEDVMKDLERKTMNIPIRTMGYDVPFSVAPSKRNTNRTPPKPKRKKKAKNGR